MCFPQACGIIHSLQLCQNYSFKDSKRTRWMSGRHTQASVTTRQSWVLPASWLPTRIHQYVVESTFPWRHHGNFVRWGLNPWILCWCSPSQTYGGLQYDVSTFVISMAYCKQTSAWFHTQELLTVLCQFIVTPEIATYIQSARKKRALQWWHLPKKTMETKSLSHKRIVC